MWVPAGQIRLVHRLMNQTKCLPEVGALSAGRLRNSGGQTICPSRELNQLSLGGRLVAGANTD